MYCVKCKRSTPNVPDSEQVVRAKNGNMMLKAICAVCSTKKNRFLPKNYAGPMKGSGIMEFIISNPNLVNTLVGLVQAAPAIAGLAFGAKKLYDHNKS